MSFHCKIYINKIFRRWCCQQHCRATGPGSVPTGRPHQEDQSGTAGKYVPASEGRFIGDAEKDHRQSPAQEKEVLTHLVVLTVSLTRQDVKTSGLYYKHITRS